MKRTGRIRPKKRTASERERIYGSSARVEWLKSQPCIIAGKPLHDIGHRCWGAIENAHTESGGMGRKADADTIVPLCSGAHQLLHAIGQRSFQTLFAVDFRVERERIAAAWAALNEGAA